MVEDVIRRRHGADLAVSRHGYESGGAYQRPPPAQGEGLGEDGHGCDGNRDDGGGGRLFEGGVELEE